CVTLRNMNARNIIVALATASLVCISEQSHFRGGVISWKPGSSPNEIIIDFRFSWRRDYSSGFYCDDSLISNGTLVAAEGSITCFSNCRNGSLGSAAVECTDYSVSEDWTTGRRQIVTTISRLNSAALFEFGFTSSAWIPLEIGGGGDWKLNVKANLNVRSDTGRINSSPTTDNAPIVRLQQNCHHKIKIPVSDPDNDDVRCRWANFDSVYSTTPLSSIPVQFLVYVYNSTDSCHKAAEFVDPTPENGLCINVPYGETWTSQLVASLPGGHGRITEIKTTSPLGMTKSPLYQTQSNEWAVNVSWTPNNASEKTNYFSYVARDSS
ncbi:SIBC-like protein, partial [Mya arenaria]